MKLSFTFAALLLAAILARPAAAGIVIDMDSATPGIQRGDDPMNPFILADGPQTINLSVWFDPMVPDPNIPQGLISTIGTNIHWTADAGVSVAPIGDIVIGDIANSGVVDPINQFGFNGNTGAIAGSTVLNPVDVGIESGFLDSLGIVGVTDRSGGGFSPSLTANATELFTVSFDVSGQAGDSVSFSHVGILSPIGATIPNRSDFQLGGVFGARGTINAPLLLADLGAVGGSASYAAVPEPSSFAVIGLVGFAAARIRRRKA